MTDCENLGCYRRNTCALAHGRAELCGSRAACRRIDARERRRAEEREASKAARAAASPTKRCVKCGRLLPAESFYKSRTCRDGRETVCRECRNERQRDRRRLLGRRELEALDEKVRALQVAQLEQMGSWCVIRREVRGMAEVSARVEPDWSCPQFERRMRRR